MWKKGMAKFTSLYAWPVPKIVNERSESTFYIDDQNTVFVNCCLCFCHIHIHSSTRCSHHIQRSVIPQTQVQKLYLYIFAYAFAIFTYMQGQGVHTTYTRQTEVQKNLFVHFYLWFYCICIFAGTRCSHRRGQSSPWLRFRMWNWTSSVGTVSIYMYICMYVCLWWNLEDYFFLHVGIELCICMCVLRYRMWNWTSSVGTVSTNMHVYMCICIYVET